MNSGTVAKYETMSLDRILALGDIIRYITYAGGSILFLWVQTSLQSEAMNVLKEF
jgi:N6-adenosine-specific RNA methylase IME4